MQNKEIEEAKKSLKEFAYTMYGTLLVGEAKTILQYIDQLENKVKELEKENMEMQVEIAEQVYFGSMPLDQMRELQAKANKYDSLVKKIKENIDKRKTKYNEILSDYGNIDTDVIFNIPNSNVRKRLNELSFEIVILQELLEGE